MDKNERENDSRGFTRVIHRAYIRDGDRLHQGEAVLLACLLHAKGAGRNSKDMEDVQVIMRDRNLEKTKSSRQ